MNNIQQVPAHPLEKMNGMAERITLPGSGIEVVVRRADVEALTADALRFAFTTPVLQQVAQDWATRAGEAAKVPGQLDRPQPALDMGQQMELARQMNAATFRAVVVAPKLDDLIAMYGGDEQLADFGMGSDFKVLKDAVDRLNPATPEHQERDKSQGAAVPAPEGGQPEQHGGEVRETAPRAADPEPRDAGDGGPV